MLLPRSKRSWLLVLLLVGSGIAWLVWSVLPRFVELPAALLETPRSSTRYLSADGLPLRTLLTEEGDRVGTQLTADQLPQDWINAMLAAEDQRFYSHGGLDLWSIARATWDNLTQRRITSGASTLTQQLIKVSQPARPRTLATKMHEALQARRLEQLWTKDQIIAAYANRVSYGHLFVGLDAAAQGYFRKPPASLTLAESALLAALPHAPSRLDPFRNPAPAAERQQWILQRMKQLRMIDPDDYDLAHGQRLHYQRSHGGFAAPHAVALIPAQPGPLRTTIDAGLQRRIENQVAIKVESLREKHVEHAAVVIIENATGHVRALVGSRDYFAQRGGQLNGAWEPRSPGSAVKPFTYALALTKGQTPASIIPDLDIEFQTKTGLYKPQNYTRQQYGPVTLRQALGCSLNLSAVRTLQNVGGPSALKDLLIDCGLTTLTEEADHYGLGLTIGNAPVRLIELTNAYATLARLGIHKPWSLTPTSSEGTRVLDAKVCLWIADILSDAQARALTFGLNTPLRLPFKMAAKTGTSTSYRDNWALGYTPQFTVGVWCGNFEGEPMNDVTGMTGAAPLLRAAFYALNEREHQTWYPLPPDAKRVRIDPRLGKRVNPKLKPPRQSRDELFFGNALPPMATADDYDLATGAAYLPPEYATWIASDENWQGNAVAVRAAESASTLRITHPTDGLTIRLDPDVPTSNQVQLRAEPRSEVIWQCDTLTITHEGEHWTATAVPGDHILIVKLGDIEQRLTLHVKAD